MPFAHGADERMRRGDELVVERHAGEIGIAGESIVQRFGRDAMKFGVESAAVLVVRRFLIGRDGGAVEPLAEFAMIVDENIGDVEFRGAGFDGGGETHFPLLVGVDGFGDFGSEGHFYSISSLTVYERTAALSISGEREEI